MAPLSTACTLVIPCAERGKHSLVNAHLVWLRAHSTHYPLFCKYSGSSIPLLHILCPCSRSCTDEKALRKHLAQLVDAFAPDKCCLCLSLLSYLDQVNCGAEGGVRGCARHADVQRRTTIELQRAVQVDSSSPWFSDERVRDCVDKKLLNQFQKHCAQCIFQPEAEQALEDAVVREHTHAAR